MTRPLTRRQRNDADPGGLVIVDKPAGMSSHDVVATIRRVVDSRKVGHGGTLDPMATGVLVVAVNRTTRLLAHLQDTAKVYEATIRLGVSTDSDDADGSVTGGASTQTVHNEAVWRAMQQFTGAIEQVPSSVSAIKVDGERAYTLARSGREFALAARPVSVERFEALDFRRPRPEVVDVDVVVECSSGTYIRALARDLGSLLGVGGHVTALRRTRVGPFDVSAALTIEQIRGAADPVALKLPDAIRAAFPVRTITMAQADALSYGQFLLPDEHHGVYGAIDESGRGVALLRNDERHARPVLVFIGRG